LKIAIIAAVAKNGVIGRSSGEMPWHSSEEFSHFKKTTLGCPVIMGRKTFESLGKPLKGRLNNILTRNKNYKPSDEIKVFPSLNDAYDYCRNEGHEKIFVIGGGNIFPEGMKQADEMIISVMDFDAEGDIYFPEINETEWKIRLREKRNGFEVIYYERRAS